MKISATHHSNGEVVELPTSTYEEVISAWQVAQDYAKLSESLKDQLKKLVPKYISDKGVSEPANGFMFRMSSVQRMNYDKATLRQVFDQDTLDLFLKPDKPKIDSYLKEHLDELGESSTLIRNSMVAEGRPYQVIKLERLDKADVK